MLKTKQTNEQKMPECYNLYDRDREKSLNINSVMDFPVTSSYYN
ncbi:hypothetical protein [Hyella patelloides]|nr:hypothetical protein [Hyella patelloides]